MRNRRAAPPPVVFRSGNASTMVPFSSIERAAAFVGEIRGAMLANGFQRLLAERGGSRGRCAHLGSHCVQLRSQKRSVK